MSLKTKQYVIENGLHALIYRSSVYLDKRGEEEPGILGAMGRGFATGWSGLDYDGYIYTDEEWNRLKAAGYKEYPESARSRPKRPVSVSMPRNEEISTSPASVTSSVSFDEADRIIEEMKSRDYLGMSAAEVEEAVKPYQDRIFVDLNSLDNGLLAGEDDDKLRKYYHAAVRGKELLAHIFNKIPDGQKALSASIEAYNVDLNFYSSASAYLDYLRNGPPSENSDGVSIKIGEKVYCKQSGICLYETVSSTNDKEVYVSDGSFFVTNKRFVYVTNTGVVAIPYSKVEYFTANWLSGSNNGQVIVSIEGRARKKIFKLGDALGPALFYSYFNKSDFRNAVDHYLNNPSSTARGGVLGYIFRIAKNSLDTEMRRLDRVAVEDSTPQSGSGCCVPLIAMIGAVVWLAKMCIC